MSNLTIPALTADEMRTVDELMVTKYGITLPQMMEMAGRHLADLAWERFLKSAKTPLPQVVALCGTGNNGGGGMVAARHLSNRGLPVTVLLAGEENRLKPIPLQQWESLSHLPVQREIDEPGLTPDLFQSADLIIDALVGYGLTGPLRDFPAQLVKKLPSTKAAILALDVPSGLNATTGVVEGHAVNADATLTLALPKTGLLKPDTQPFVGELYLADIGVPPQLYAYMGLEPQYLFIDAPVIPVSIQ
ncbi:MAG: NAD(P)H-hydrate epimerase [Fidelibacterota bacterium]